MRIHEDWSTSAFDLAPLAARTGPFPRRSFLRVWWRHRASPGAGLLLVEDDRGLLPLMLHEGAMSFLGEPDLTDYHTPLGKSASDLMSTVAHAGRGFRYDSLPIEAAAALAEGLARAGIEAEPVEQDVVAVLALPTSFDDYESGLTRKERHEMRRKQARFDETFATARIERAQGSAAVGLFAELHRLAKGGKSSFMTRGMERFFGALHAEAGGVVDVLYGDEHPLAASFGFEEDDAYYLYNTAYDPAASSLSPGVVLLYALIRRCIRRGLRTFDFLKGDEPYKFRMGAEPRRLYVLEGSLE